MRAIPASLALAGCLAFVCPALEAKEMTTLRIMVNNEAGDPVSRASVVVHKLKKNKLKAKGDGMQLKTSNRGSAPLPPLRQGEYMLQVISPGYQTFGGKIELSQLEQTYTVTLKPPKKQFSVHEKKE